MSDSNLKTPTCIIALHYSKDELFHEFIENVGFAKEISIINLTENPLPTTIKNVKIYELNSQKIQDIYDKIIENYQNEWVLLLHTTYRINNPLLNEINSVILENKSHAFNISKEFYFYEKKIKYGKIERFSECLFFKNNLPKSSDQQKLKINLKNKIQNISYIDFDSYTKGLSTLNKVRVENLVSKGIKPNISHLLFHPFIFFIKNYFINGNFLDGKEGFILCYLHAFNELRLYLVIWLKNNNLS